ncbi:MAG TPA: mechanosensitive ion channel domain-containing protein [Alphaproteobacteria bacterium]|nr:mechanosensitive ion channel domain-containing protein [Alphaproteobacteria bacterium]
MCRFSFLIALALCILTVTTNSLAQDEGEDSGEPFAFEIEAVNDGLPPADPPLSLDTPRAAVESFLEAVRNEDFGRAAHALNLNTVPTEEQSERGPELALQLAFVLRRYDLIDWSELPDQPDARVLPDIQQSVGPYSRRSVELGEIKLDGRPVPFSIQRFSAGGEEPVWLFSPFSVERVDDIFREIEPGILGRWIPLRERLKTLGQPSVWEWSAAAVLLLASFLIGFGVRSSVHLVSRRLPLMRAQKTRKLGWPLGALSGALAFRAGTEYLFLLTGPVAANLDIVSELVAFAAGAWLLVQIVDFLTLGLSERYVVPLADDDPENRRIKTTTYVTRRLALAVIALLSIGYVLMRVGVFEGFGISVLASAGALGVLVAIAARPLLGNMVSGLQIALTDPARIGDIVVFDGQWAIVEDISFAHTVLHTWTDTRLIVPHSEFLARPFENWSKNGEAVKRIVKLPVDYRIDVDRIREKVAAIVEGDPRSTDDKPLVEMVEITDETAVLWIWISGTDSLACWYLHNEVKEALIAYLKELDGGAYLPRKRHILVSDDRDPPPPPDGG